MYDRLVLQIYRRHLIECGQADQGRRYRRCRCPIWVQGTLAGEKIRKSLDLVSWEAASELVRQWEARGGFSGKVIPVPEAVQKFLEDARVRHLTDATLAKMTVVLKKQLVPWSESRGITYVSQLDVEALRDFRATWADGAVSAIKKLERLRSFFRFCQDSGWVEKNPARLLKAPKVVLKPTLPFSHAEMGRILKACDEYPRKNSFGYDNRARIKALVLLLRHSGLRFQDAMKLELARVNDGKLLLYTQKTGTPVWVPLPPFVVAALRGIVRPNEERFFWNGLGNPRSCMSVWDRSLRRVFKTAGVPNGHAHRFRDTFATELLVAGVPLEQVSILLGHSSTKITEKHYSPWVKSRQTALEEAVRKTWERELPTNVVKFARKSTLVDEGD